MIASDNGATPRTAEARVIVTTNNVNDQAPQFDDNKVATLMGNADPGTTVIIVRAVDEDGDAVTYSFDGTIDIENNSENIRILLFPYFVNFVGTTIHVFKDYTINRHPQLIMGHSLYLLPIKINPYNYVPMNL